jgi:hypothetical protein
VLRSGRGADRLGLGAESGELTGREDQFDTYRKRMMLSYKYRPNPLVWSSQCIMSLPPLASTLLTQPLPCRTTHDVTTNYQQPVTT